MVDECRCTLLFLVVRDDEGCRSFQFSGKVLSPLEFYDSIKHEKSSESIDQATFVTYVRVMLY